MKKILVVLLSLFLLSAIGCETTTQDVAKTEAPKVEAVEGPFAGDFDLTGTWALNEATIAPQCGGNKKGARTVEITQTGDEVSVVDKSDADWGWKSKAYKNYILMPEKKIAGNVKLYTYKLVVSPDGNIVTGKVPWDYDNGVCDGYTNVIYTRK